MPKRQQLKLQYHTYLESKP